VFAPVVIDDLTDQAAFIADLNTLAGEDYSGSFSVVGGKVIWTNVGADLFLSGSATILHTPFTYEITSNIAQSILFADVNAVIDWGDGSVQTVSGVGSVPSGVHNYSSTATYDVRVFGTYTGISFNDGYLTNVDGFLPAGLVSFYLAN